MKNCTLCICLNCKKWTDCMFCIKCTLDKINNSRTECNDMEEE